MPEIGELGDALYGNLVRAMISMGNHRYDNVIHASNLVDFCPREYCLSLETDRKFNASPIETVPSVALTFHLGNRIHDLVRDILDESGILVHNELHMEYKHREIVRVTGTCDNIVELMDGQYILDVKSIGPAGANGFFRADGEITDKPYTGKNIMVKPYVRHEIQVMVYMWLAEKLKIPNVSTDRGFVLYVPKTAIKKPFIIGAVNRSSDTFKEFESDLDLVAYYIANKELPARLCTSLKSEKAKTCRFTNECFNRVEDTLITMNEEDLNVSAETKPAKRKSKPKGDGEDAARLDQRGNSRRRGHPSSELLDRVQVSKVLRRLGLDGSMRTEQQKGSNPYRSRTRIGKAS